MVSLHKLTFMYFLSSTKSLSQAHRRCKRNSHQVSNFNLSVNRVLTYCIFDNCQMSAVGEFYPLEGVLRTPITLKGILHQRRGLPPDPYVQVDRMFHSAPRPVEIYRSIVHVDKFRFLVYGYNDRTCPINQLLLRIKPSSNWYGEIIVFVLGTRVPFLSSPARVKRIYHEAAIQL